MFDTAFATLFHAVERIRRQLESANAELRPYLAEELVELRQLGDQYMDHWFTLDEQIAELMETFNLVPASESNTDASGLAGLHVFSNPNPASESPPGVPMESVLSYQPSHPESDSSLVDPESTLSSSHWQDFAFADLHAVSAAFRKGMGYFDLLLFGQASESLAEVVRTSPNPVAEVYLAAALTEQGKTDEALEHLAAVRNAASDTLFHCAANEVEAQLRVKRGELDAAISCLQDSGRRMPEYQDVWYNLGVCYARQAKWAKAEDALRQAVRLDPADTAATTLLGQCQLEQGSVEAAAETCRKGLQKSRHDPNLRFLQCRVLEAEGDVERCLRACRQLADSRPDLSEAWYLLTWTLLRAGDGEQAAAVLKKRISVEPSDGTAKLQLGITYLLLEAYDDAEAMLLDALPTSQEKSLVWIALGRISAARQDVTQAQKRFLRALRDPRKEVKRLALYYFGVTLLSCGRLQESQKYLKAALILGPPNPAILIAMGRVADRLGRPAEADRLFSRAEETVEAPSAGA